MSEAHSASSPSRDASDFGWEKWAKKSNVRLFPETEKAKAGDFVVYDFSHIGVVVEDQKNPKTKTKTKIKIKTVEGNTNGQGTRDSTSGDGVSLKERAPGLVKCYVRLQLE